MLNGYIILISGIDTGIGLETAKYFLKKRATVIGVGNKESNETLGDNYIHNNLDISNEAAMSKLIKFIEEKFQKLDSVITVSDEKYVTSIIELDSLIFETASIKILRTPMLLTKYTEKLLRKSNNPSIVHDISVQGYLVTDDYLTSVLSSAMLNFIKQSSPQLKGIRVNGVAYGLINNHQQIVNKEIENKIPIGRIGNCEDVAKVNAFLVSDKARYINSGILTVDGGLYTTHPRAINQ